MPKTKTSFKKGKIGGRPKGAINVFTKTVKETVLKAFEHIQDDPQANIIAFAKKYPRDFYPIAARLIPTEIQNHFSKIQIEIVRTDPEDDAENQQASPGAEKGNEGTEAV